MPHDLENSLSQRSLVILRPGDFVFLDELLEAVEAAVFLGLVEADADELDALVVILGVDLFHLGHLGDARAAPGCPEVDHDDLAFQAFDRNGRALDGVGEFQVEWLADAFFLPARRLDHRGELGVREFLDEPIFDARPWPFHPW